MLDYTQVHQDILGKHLSKQMWLPRPSLVICSQVA